jgi:hypothetical protein
VLYGCETLREEHRLRVFENRVLRRIFGRTRMKQQEAEESCVVGRFITSHVFRMTKSRGMGLALHVARMREKMSAYRLLIGNFEEKTALGKTRCRWEDNIKIDLREM